MDADAPTENWPICGSEEIPLSIVVLEIDQCTPAETLAHIKAALKRAAMMIATQYPPN
jgi:hypothetical protein